MHFYNESNGEGKNHSLIFLLTAQLFLDLYIVSVYGLLSVNLFYFLFFYESQLFLGYMGIAYGSTLTSTWTGRRLRS